MLILNEKLYNELYTDEVSKIIISADDPAKVKVDIENTLIGGEEVKTRAEYLADLNKDGGEVTLIIIGVMAAAISLTLIGISGNQVIGFASRKKEYAMLHSCACPKKDIIRMILIENALLFGISVIVSACLCVPVTMLVERIFVLSDTGIFIVPRYVIMAISLLCLWGVTMITSMSPINSVKKMNTAMEMKYE
jgi:ABC-type antimicrobial peptide transport system permease subunit